MPSLPAGGAAEPNLLREEENTGFATSQPITEGFALGDELALHLTPNLPARAETATLRQTSGQKEKVIKRGKETGVKQT